MTAQVVTITEGPAEYSELQRLRKIVWDWASTEAGVVTGSVTTHKYTGEIVRLITKPDGGAAAPSDNYVVKINDEDGFDVLMGAGAARDTANTEQVLASSLGVCKESTLTLEITAAGDAKSGLIVLYIKP